MSNPRGVRGLAICLIFSPAAALAESSPPQVAASVARAARPGCAKLVCQRRALSADGGVSAEQPAAEASPSGVSVLVGLGAGSFRGPKPELGYIDLEVVQERYPDDATGPPGSAPSELVGSTIDERVSPRRAQLEGPAVSLGVALQQPLLGAAALRLGLEERFVLAAVLPLSSGSLFAGFGDILLTARQARWPVQVAVGPSLAVAQLNVRDDELGLFEEAGVIVAGAALLRLDLAPTPGTLDLVGHYGKPLNYEGGSSYRDLQLAFALNL